MHVVVLIVLLLVVPGVDRTDAVREAAQAVLADQYPDDAHRLEVRVRRVDGTFDDDAPLRVSFAPGMEMPRGMTRVSVFAGAEDGTWTEAGWALLYVAHFDSVLVARTALDAGEPVTLDHLSTAWMETTRFPGEPLRPATFRTMTQDVPMIAERTLHADRVLRPADVRPPYLADTGDRVVMQYARGALTFELTCKAREPGVRGDEVRLYSEDTGRMYRARLTGPGTAEWIETL